MRVFQSKSFAKKVKKLTKSEKTTLDEEVKKIIAKPQIGVEKKGDLKGIFIHKFKVKTSLYLLSYRFTKDSLELIMIGPHENYYRDLKKQLK
ncbi:hypothetical protein DGMP_26660 [Desulfomarina profundi]|uniref:Addiction module toxin RelE n=1 Tax=Desulfomarina profundi TaxID=2772557 RepID=A0A8D5FMT2_9BACT|nr:type II toxin-antitoxin system RelE/ParE family toxin [Desulfomarina profundi]BCL61973.1 hypothetical protein DGMP_26660 [Desulfomarina profundi]